MKKSWLVLPMILVGFYVSTVSTNAETDLSPAIISGEVNSNDPYFPIQPTEEDLKGDEVQPHEIPLEKEAGDNLRSISPTALDSVNQQIISYPLAKITQDYAPEFPRFGYADGVGRPRGLVIHETANPSSTIFNEIAYMRGNWQNAFTQVFVDQNNIIEIHPTEYAAWGAGRYANPYFIHVELVRHTGDKTAFYKSINNQSYYAAYQLKKYALKASRADVNSAQNNPQGSIWGHFEVSSILGGTDHGDPLDYYR